jgi:multiple sugar transport system ATP-binding protein
MTLADRIVVLSAGHIEQVGSPLDLYEHPDNLFVAGFIGSPGMNFIEATVEAAGDFETSVRLRDGSLVRCAVNTVGAKTGDIVTLGVRPEHITRDKSANVLNAKAIFVESLGSVTYAYCEFAGVKEELTCVLDGTVRVLTGDALQLGVAPDRCYLFDAQGKAFQRVGVANA